MAGASAEAPPRSPARSAPWRPTFAVVAQLALALAGAPAVAALPGQAQLALAFAGSPAAQLALALAGSPAVAARPGRAPSDVRRIWRANRSAAASPEASRLADYLEECVRSLRSPYAETPDPRHTLYAESPETNVGKVIRCLAERPSTTSIASAFFGSARANGVFSAALGLRARAERALAAGDTSPAVPKVVSAEETHRDCEKGKLYLEGQDLLRFVDLQCRRVCADSGEEEGEEAERVCAAELAATFCPAGRLDVLAVDAGLSGGALMRGMLYGPCSPRVMVVENSGLRWWRYKELVVGGLKEEEVRWYMFEEELHRAASAGRGPWRLAIDRQRSLILCDRSWDPDPIRRFSVYVAAA